VKLYLNSFPTQDREFTLARRRIFSFLETTVLPGFITMSQNFFTRTKYHNQRLSQYHFLCNGRGYINWIFYAVFLVFLPTLYHNEKKNAFQNLKSVTLIFWTQTQTQTQEQFIPEHVSFGSSRTWLRLSRDDWKIFISSSMLGL
jgi:hypothetical protein